MQGTIDVESRVGKGTRITVILPHRIAQDMENAEIAITILTEADFEVDHAADGVICVDMLDKAGMNRHISKLIRV